MKLYRLSDSYNETLFATTDTKEFNKKVKNVVQEMLVTDFASVENLSDSKLLEMVTGIDYEFIISDI